MTYFVTIFEEKGNYHPHFDPSEDGLEKLEKIGKKLGAEPVFRTAIEVEQGRIIAGFVEEANWTGTFDKKKLEDRLKNGNGKTPETPKPQDW
jgi:hypothetical protein